MNDYLNFIAVFIVALISPGPDFILVLKNSLTYHTSKKYYTALGISVGNIIHGVITLTFLTLLEIYFTTAIGYLKYLGSAYLFYLGVKMFFAKSNLQVEPERKDESARELFLEGLLINLTNPKLIIFLSSLFSFYITKSSFDLTQKFYYVTTMFFFCLGWFYLVVYLFSRKKLKNKLLAYNFFLNKGLGALFVFFSINLFLYEF